MRALPSFLLPLFTLSALSRAHEYQPAVLPRQVTTTPFHSATSSVPATNATVTGLNPPTNATTNTTTLPTFAFTLASTNPTAVPLSSIVAGAAPAPTNPLSVTPAPGSVPTYMAKAPPLPDPNTLRPSNYPALDKVPPTDSPEVQQWIAEVKNSGVAIPGFQQNVVGGCAANPQAASDPSRCWWSCGGCTRKTDITDCPTHMEWGLTYDDGPAYHTTQLLEYLEQMQLKSTFFVVGSRVISFPSILQAEYLGQHQIAVHTWSHPSLTTLTNEQIIAELGWSKKVIKDVLGVTPNIMRPPYGDIDDRVRAISIAMGLTPVMWTRVSPTATFDTGDFDINGGLLSVSGVLYNWENIIGNATARDRGFIVLEHDLFQQTVEVATGYILPDAIAHQFHIKPVITCLGLTYEDAYIELNDNKTNPPVIQISGAVSLTATPSGGLVQTTGSHNSGSKQSANGLALAVATIFGGFAAGAMIVL